MNFYKSKIIKFTLLIITLTLNTLSYAANTPTTEFFFSNNTHEISLEQAYERLTSTPQHELIHSAIRVFQNNHIEQGKFAGILGTYQMAGDKNITGDNTEIFYASPAQVFSKQQLFFLATKLANTLLQESVAVFIPSKQSAAGNIIMTFTSHEPSITNAISEIREKLPASYSSAFSLHLSNKNSGFNNAKVAEIEWLGSKVSVDEITKAFPQENVSYQQGQAYLVYKNGRAELL